jgi:hypothetical protein
VALSDARVDAYSNKLPAAQREIVEAVRRIVRLAAPESHEAFKWAEPVFESGGPFAYVKAHSRHVTFGFWRGADLDGEGRLESSGEKMAHMKLRSVSEIDERLLAALVRQAVELNRAHGDPSRTR